MARIVIADDHLLFREALRTLLESQSDFEVCGEAGDGAEAVKRVREVRPDLLLLDISMPGNGGLDAVRDLADDLDGLRILLLTAAIDDAELMAALQLGARGVIFKDAPSASLFRAIRGVLAGEYWVGRERVGGLVEVFRGTLERRATVPPSAALSERELVIVAGVVAAMTNREMAAALDISEKTIKRHLTNIFDKLGLSGRVELAMHAVQSGWTLPAFPSR
jgi:DNA-binding NarL/FixJ family response regulator